MKKRGFSDLRLGRLHLERQVSIYGVDPDLVAGVEAAAQDHARPHILDLPLDGVLPDPRLLVMITIVFLKSTVRPVPVGQASIVQGLKQDVEGMA